MSESKVSNLSLSHFVYSVSLVGLLILPAACQSTLPSPSLGSPPAPTAKPVQINDQGPPLLGFILIPSASATSDISSGGGNPPDPVYGQATPLPSPTSVMPPDILGPTALPSHFSPACPAGSTYTPPPFTGPMATAQPIDPRFPPPPLAPHEVRYQFALPLEIRQSNFCGGTVTSHWNIDSTGVLSMTGPGQTTPTRRQLNSAQIAELMTLLDERQPQQWMQTEVYRCQAAEVCPMVHHVQVSSVQGSSTGWQERGNLAYPEIYQQTMTSLMQKLTAFLQAAPLSQSPYTYRSAIYMGSSNATGQSLGTQYKLTRHGQLNGFIAFGTPLEVSQAKAIQLSSAQQQEFRELLQQIDPLTRYRQWVPDPSVWTPVQPSTVPGPETTWGFEMEATAGNWDVNPTASISSKYIPDTEAGRALRADLTRLTALLDKWLEQR